MELLPRAFSFVKARPKLYSLARRIVRSRRPLVYGEPPPEVNGVVAVGALDGMTEVERQAPFDPPPALTIDDQIDPVYQPYDRSNEVYHVGSIPGAQVLLGEAVLTSGSEWVWDVTVERFTARKDRFPVSGFDLHESRLDRVVMLSCYAGTGYFHWLLEVLPRIGLLRKAGVEPSEAETLLVNGTYASYQRHTLSALGIDPSLPTTALRHPRIRADELIVTSHPRLSGGTPRWVIDFVRQSFPAKRPQVDPGKRLFISRARTHHGRIENEEIDRILQERGFEVVALEDYSLNEKSYLFSNAEVVAGSTGAGLAHVVFSSEGTTVVEINGRGKAYPILWDLAGQAGARYAYIGGNTGVTGVEPQALADTLDLVLDGS